MYLFIFIVIVTFIIFLALVTSPNQKYQNNATLVSDMEIFIAQLEIKPDSNKSIKYIASYLENLIMPGEDLLAVASAWCLGGQNYAVVTSKRVIFKSSGAAVEIITPIEKVQTVMQNGTVVNVNGNWIDLLSPDKSGKIVSLINKQVSSVQTVAQAIKIENKIVTEETVTSQLQKLSDLYAAGVLTEYEYSIKKQELLDKMK